jgi:hypothetical protein
MDREKTCGWPLLGFSEKCVRVGASNAGVTEPQKGLPDLEIVR